MAISTTSKKAMDQRIKAAHEATLNVVATGQCPECKSPLRKNLALTGWWQCAQFGATGFRADPNGPACNWQGFTQ